MYVENIPSARDHCQLQVLIKVVGGPNSSINRILERIKRVSNVTISKDNPARTVLVKYLLGYSPDWNHWGQLQAHRRILGLICVGILSPNLTEEQIVDAYKKEWSQYNSTLYDSRCLVFGAPGSAVSSAHSSRQNSFVSGARAKRRAERTGTLTETQPETATSSGAQSRISSRRGTLVENDDSARQPPAAGKVARRRTSSADGVSGVSPERRRRRNSALHSSLRRRTNTENAKHETILNPKALQEAYTRLATGASKKTSVETQSEPEDVDADHALLNNAQQGGRRMSLAIGGLASNSLRASNDSLSRAPVPIIHNYATPEHTQDLENHIKDFIEQLYWVLEGKRLDRSFERADSLTCPTVPEEEKFRVGLDKNSKLYRKRCIGRLRKQQADYCLLAGLPSLAYDAYVDATERLKAVNDWLWLAAAYEGLACTSIIARYSQELRSCYGLQRVPTFTSADELRKNSEKNAAKEKRDTLKNQRSIKDDAMMHRPTHQRNSSVDMSRLAVREAMVPNDILDKCRTALFHYAKFSFAAFIELECIFKAARIYIYERQFAELNDFLMATMEKFQLPGHMVMDSYSRVGYSRYDRSVICHMLASIYKECGFHRKASFYLRFTAIYRLRLDCDQPELSTADYKQVYPLLLYTLEGTRLNVNPKELNPDRIAGWSDVQKVTLEELIVAAEQAGYLDVAVRHICLLLHTQHHTIPTHELREILQRLSNMSQQASCSPAHIQIPGGLLLPPVPLTTLPMVLSFAVKPHAQYFAPVMPPTNAGPSIFAYTPIVAARGFVDNKIRWTSGCPSDVLVRLRNPVDVELELENFMIITEGAECESIPHKVTLRPRQTAQIHLIAIPKSSGLLQITGYAFELCGVPSLCRLSCCPWLSTRSVEVEVTPALPLVKIETTFARCRDTTKSGGKHPLELSNAEVSLYTGQSFEGVVALANTSPEPIDRIRVLLEKHETEDKQPFVEVLDGPEVVERYNPSNDKECWYEYGTPDAPLDLGSGQKHVIRLRIHAVDFCSLQYAKAESARSPKRQRTQSESSGGAEEERVVDVPSATRDVFVRFAYSGRLCHYERSCVLTLAINLRPAVLIRDLKIVTGGSVDSRYMLLSALNVCNHPLDIQYSSVEATGERKTHCMPLDSKEPCQLPVPFACCDRATLPPESLSPDAFCNPYAVYVHTNTLLKACRAHLRNALDVRWTMRPEDNGTPVTDAPSGMIAVWDFVSTLEMCKQMIHPPLSAKILINRFLHRGRDAFKCSVGQVLYCQLDVINPGDTSFSDCEVRVVFSLAPAGASTELAADGRVRVFGDDKFCFDLDGEEQRSLRWPCVFSSPGRYKLDALCLLNSTRDRSQTSFSLLPDPGMYLTVAPQTRPAEVSGAKVVCFGETGT